jgi:hypothetical protein
MFEIYTETPYRMAREYHRNALKASQQWRLAASTHPYVPGLWDHVALRLGNWLIKLGCNLKSQSIFSQLSKTHA